MRLTLRVGEGMKLSRSTVLIALGICCASPALVLAEVEPNSTSPLGWLAMAMTQIVPSIDKMATISSIPAITRQHLSIQWFAVLVATVIIATAPRLPLDERDSIPHKWKVLLGMALYAFVVVGLWSGSRVGSNPGTGYYDWVAQIRAHASSSRLTLAALGLVVYGLGTFFMLAVFSLARNFKRLWLS